MRNLVIFRQPQPLKSGDDVLGAKAILGLNKAGIPVRSYELSSKRWAGKLWSSRLPGRRTLFEYGPAHIGLFPDAKVIVLEKAIDVERLKPVPVERSSDLPFLVWTGHVTSMADPKQSAGLLNRVHVNHSLKQQIISGQNKPARRAKCCRTRGLMGESV